MLSTIDKVELEAYKYIPSLVLNEISVTYSFIKTKKTFFAVQIEKNIFKA